MEAVFQSLNFEEKGKLIDHFFKYVNDENPEPIDKLTEVAFVPIKRILKNDLKSWESKVEQNRKKGNLGNLKRWHPDLAKRVLEGTLELEVAMVLALGRKTEKSIATAIPSDKKRRQTSLIKDKGEKIKDKRNKLKEINAPAFSFRKNMLKLGIKKELVDDFLKNRKLKRLANTETALKNLEIEFNKCYLEINQLMEKVVSNGWGSFKKSWLEKENFKATEKPKMLTDKMKQDYGIK